MVKRSLAVFVEEKGAEEEKGTSLIIDINVRQGCGAGHVSYRGTAACVCASSRPGKPPEEAINQ